MATLTHPHTHTHTQVNVMIETGTVVLTIPTYTIEKIAARADYLGRSVSQILDADICNISQYQIERINEFTEKEYASVCVNRPTTKGNYTLDVLTIAKINRLVEQTGISFGAIAYHAVTSSR